MQNLLLQSTCSFGDGVQLSPGLGFGWTSPDLCLRGRPKRPRSWRRSPRGHQVERVGLGPPRGPRGANVPAFGGDGLSPSGREAEGGELLKAVDLSPLIDTCFRHGLAAWSAEVGLFLEEIAYFMEVGAAKWAMRRVNLTRMWKVSERWCSSRNQWRGITIVHQRGCRWCFQIQTWNCQRENRLIQKLAGGRIDKCAIS